MTVQIGPSEGSEIAHPIDETLRVGDGCFSLSSAKNAGQDLVHDAAKVVLE